MAYARSPSMLVKPRVRTFARIMQKTSLLDSQWRGEVGPSPDIFVLHNVPGWVGTWVGAREFAPDRSHVHLENRMSRGAGWANRCIIVVRDCDRGFGTGSNSRGTPCLFCASFGNL